MLRKIRLTLAIISFTLITLLFLDFTGSIHKWFGWLAEIQFIPAVLAMNAGVILLLLLITLAFGRVYCSMLCPLGILQDIISWISSKRKKNRFAYTKAKNWLRYTFLAIFVALFLIGLNSIAILIAPYSAYGRIVSSLFAPVYQYTNNGLAYLAERADSYMFYDVDVWIKSIPVLVIAIITLIAIILFAWFSGRSYCNTVCPVGTVLGMISRYSWYKPIINESKCVGCGLCSRNCKASCIDFKNHNIDYSRCVACMDCFDKCASGAITYSHKSESSSYEEIKTKKPHTVDESRRDFLATMSVLATASVIAKSKTVDGGLAIIQDKKTPKRITPIRPAGSRSLSIFTNHCTACQLCVSVCPNKVLTPSSKLDYYMQPEVNYELGYCRPECNKCSQVCPTGAILPISIEEKSSTQIGHAVWIQKNCVVTTDNVNCGNCARHCPTGAIKMIAKDPNNPDSLKFPMIDIQHCIGCGACENLCPARPFSAIYVEGYENHRSI